MAKNNNLNKAKELKNDEFYTQITDIEKELKNYKEQFKGKIVFCNCDDPEWSNFWLYFKLNFEALHLKKLISTHYHKEENTYKLEYDGVNEIKTNLDQNGDFRSPECIEILKDADIVVTNPPFSLFREYLDQLLTYDKKFVIIGNKNSITYKEIFPLIKENIVWLGHLSPSEFKTPIGTTHKINGLSRWFTNLDIVKRHEFLETGIFYYGNEQKYSKYDNYEAINIDKVNEIPEDYFEVMGVPITFIDKYCAEQFDIIGLDRYTVPKEFLVGGRLAINGKPKYARILIKRKNNVNQN